MADTPNGHRCETCRYFKSQPREISGRTMDGRCRRYPPTVVGATVDTSDVQPYVPNNSWCGEYAPANPETIADGAATMARLVLLGDLVAARALADKLRE